MRRTAMKRRRPVGIPPAVQQTVRGRSGGLCEAPLMMHPSLVKVVCGRFGSHPAQHMHHVRLRSQGGKHTPENLLHLCHHAHEWTHANPGQAYELGLMRKAGL